MDLSVGKGPGRCFLAVTLTLALALALAQGFLLQSFSCPQAGSVRGGRVEEQPTGEAARVGRISAKRRAGCLPRGQQAGCVWEGRPAHPWHLGNRCQDPAPWDLHSKCALFGSLLGSTGKAPPIQDCQGSSQRAVCPPSSQAAGRHSERAHGWLRSVFNDPSEQSAEVS